MKGRRIYKFDRFPLLSFAILVPSILPAMSIFEFITHGNIDLDSVGKGRLGISTWKLYLLSWPCFLYFFIEFICPAILYTIRGHVFILEGNELIVGKNRVQLDNVIGLERRWFGGVSVISSDGSFIRFRPNMVTGGYSLLEQIVLSKKFE